MSRQNRLITSGHRRTGLWVLGACMALPMSGCTAVLGLDERSPLVEDTSVDGASDSSVPEVDSPDAPPVDTLPDSSLDTTMLDTGAADGLADTPVDSGPVDTGLPDTGPADTGPADTGPLDTGPLDTGPLDTGPLDTGPLDTGPPDTGPADTGPADTGPPDTGPADTGVVDSGSDTPAVCGSGRSLVLGAITYTRTEPSAVGLLSFVRNTWTSGASFYGLAWQAPDFSPTTAPAGVMIVDANGFSVLGEGRYYVALPKGATGQLTSVAGSSSAPPHFTFSGRFGSEPAFNARATVQLLPSGVATEITRSPELASGGVTGASTLGGFVPFGAGAVGSVPGHLLTFHNPSSNVVYARFIRPTAAEGSFDVTSSGWRLGPPDGMGPGGASEPASRVRGDANADRAVLFSQHRNSVTLESLGRVQWLTYSPTFQPEPGKDWVFNNFGSISETGTVIKLSGTGTGTVAHAVYMGTMPAGPTYRRLAYASSSGPGVMPPPPVALALTTVNNVDVVGDIVYISGIYLGSPRVLRLDANTGNLLNLDTFSGVPADQFAMLGNGPSSGLGVITRGGTVSVGRINCVP